MEKYDLDQKIVFDEKTGDFLLQWNGHDGKRKTVVYRPANRLHAVVAAWVQRDAEGKNFRYVYAVRNLPNSQRELHSLYITVRAEAGNWEVPDGTWGPSLRYTSYLKKVLAAPDGWAWAQTRGGRTGLAPGEAAYGFVLGSSGLPAPVPCFVHIRPGMKGVGEEPPEQLMAALDPVSWLIPNGVTVGPVAPPEKVEPTAFLREVEAMIDVSLEQGWILSSSLAAELKGILQDGLGSLHRKNPEGTRESLARLLKLVEEEKGKRLLSEAYALLRYNTEYVLSHLPP